MLHSNAPILQETARIKIVRLPAIYSTLTIITSLNFNFSSERTERLLAFSRIEISFFSIENIIVSLSYSNVFDNRTPSKEQ